MNTRISTGTGLALLAGAITLHAILPPALARLEPSAAAAWAPADAPPATAPGQAQTAGNPATAPIAPAPAAPPAPAPVSITAIAGSSGTITVLFRHWSSGCVDRRPTSSTNGPSRQSGWQPMRSQAGNAP